MKWEYYDKYGLRMPKPRELIGCSGSKIVAEKNDFYIYLLPYECILVNEGEGRLVSLTLDYRNIIIGMKNKYWELGKI